MAELVGFSRFHLVRFAGKELGENLVDLVRRLHLERSAIRLSDTHMSVAEIAREAGFSGPEAFTRAFRNAYGQPPSAYRASGKVEWHLPSASELHWTREGTLELSAGEAGGFPLKICYQPTRRYAVVRVVGEYSASLKDAWRIMCRQRPWLADALPDTEFISVFHDNYRWCRDRSHLRSDIGFRLKEDQQCPSGFRQLTLPKGSFISTLDHLSPSQRSECWRSLNDLWVPASGKRAVNVPAFDLYHRCPSSWEASLAQPCVGLSLDLGDAGEYPSILGH